MAVMLYHFGILGMGWMGVELFFVLSGFLITQNLLQSRTATPKAYFKNFYGRRFLRIFPAYYGLLALALIAYLITGHPSGTLEQMPCLLTYTYNIALAFLERTQDTFYHYLWSLSFEEQFYLFWPLCVWMLPTKALRVLVLTLIITSPLLRYLEATLLEHLLGSPDLVGGLVYYLPFGKLDAFTWGAALAVFPVQRLIHRPAPWLWASFALFMGAGLISYILIDRNMPYFFHSNYGYPVGSRENAVHIWGYTVAYFLFAAMILMTIHPKGEGTPFSRALAWAPLSSLGKVSYGAYLIHMPLCYVAKHLKLLPDNSLILLLYFLPFTALVYTLAWLSYRYLESPFLKLKDRYFPYPR